MQVDPLRCPPVNDPSFRHQCVWNHNLAARLAGDQPGDPEGGWVGIWLRRPEGSFWGCTRRRRPPPTGCARTPSLRFQCSRRRRTTRRRRRVVLWRRAQCMLSLLETFFCHRWGSLLLRIMQTRMLLLAHPGMVNPSCLTRLHRGLLVIVLVAVPGSTG